MEGKPLEPLDSEEEGSCPARQGAFWEIEGQNQERQREEAHGERKS